MPANPSQFAHTWRHFAFWVPYVSVHACGGHRMLQCTLPAPRQPALRSGPWHCHPQAACQAAVVFAWCALQVRFLQGRQHTWYAGSFTLFNTHEIAVMSGVLAQCPSVAALCLRARGLAVSVCMLSPTHKPLKLPIAW